MDRPFVRWILPALVEAKWPQMRRMCIRGVGRWTRTCWRPEPLRDHERSSEDVLYRVIGHSEANGYKVQVTRIALTSYAKAQLQEAVSKATLILNEEQSGDYEDLYGGEAGVPV